MFESHFCIDTGVANQFAIYLMNGWIYLKWEPQDKLSTINVKRLSALCVKLCQDFLKH